MSLHGGDIVTAEIWLTPSMDAYISQYYANKNFGKIPYLFCNRYQGCGDIYRSLLWFDLCSLHCNQIPPNSQIKYAILYLPIFRNETPCDNNLYVYRLFQCWDQYKVNWNNQPGFATPAEAFVNVEAGFFGTLEICITDLVQSWFDGFYTNFGIMLTCDESFDSLLGFFSTEFHNSDYWPRLRIGYFDPCCNKMHTCCR